MEIKASVDDLRKKKLFIGLPCYGGMMTGMCAKSCLDLQGMAIQFGVEIRFSFLFNESLITRARNYLTDEFLRSTSTRPNPNFNDKEPESETNKKTREEPYTHLLFIDSDIHFDPRDVFALLALDRDIIGAPYPKKSIKWWAVQQATYRHANWGGIKAAIVKNILDRQKDGSVPEISNTQLADIAAEKGKSLDPSEMDKLVGDFVFNAVAGTQQFNVTEPIEVLEIGTGYMMIKREVFEYFEKAYPEKRYRPDHMGQKFFDGSRHIHAYFDCEIDRWYEHVQQEDGSVKVEQKGTERYLSEDYLFCQKARKIVKNKEAIKAYPQQVAEYEAALAAYNVAEDKANLTEPVAPPAPIEERVKVWLCPWMLTHHVGTYAFTGNLPAIANYLGKL